MPLGDVHTILIYAEEKVKQGKLLATKNHYIGAE
jgi:hypothetical protein